MGILGIIGDQYYLIGLKTSNLNNFKIAFKLFPFERSIVIGEAETYSRSKILDANSFHAAKQAVLYDPYSVQFLVLQMQNAFVFGDNKLAHTSFLNLEKIVPNNVLVRDFKKRASN